MEKVILTNKDLGLLKDNYSSLKINVSNNSIVGSISFDLTYKDKRIKDTYQIEILLTCGENSILPTVKEIDNKIIKMAKRKKIEIDDLHLNSKDGTLCLIIPPKEKLRYPNGFNLQEFLDHIQEHLYWVSYFDRYGVQPWKEQAHGIDGYIELYREDFCYRREVREKLENSQGRKLQRTALRKLIKERIKEKKL